jgi:hypothetical protein
MWTPKEEEIDSCSPVSISKMSEREQRKHDDNICQNIEEYVLKD